MAVESAADWRWLAAVDFAGAGIELVPLFFTAIEGAQPPEAVNIPCTALLGGRLELPSLAGVVEALATANVVGCLVPAAGAPSRLAAMAADLLGLPVLQLVSDHEQLGNLGNRSKPRADLFLLADQELLPAALSDPRYGSTLLPVGHPGRVTASGGGNEESRARWGGDQAAGRLLAAVVAWRDGGPAEAPPQLSIIVPAFREAANLPLVCDRLLAALEGRVGDYEILLVDDASPDDTYRVACGLMWRSPRIRALTKHPPRGMGNAIRRGLEQARGQFVAITMGDGSDEVERIPEMLAKVRDEGYGLAIGSRYRYRRNYQTVPWIYRFWSSIFRLCTRLSIGLRLSDYTNAFRVFDRRIFDRYGPESGGFEISPETTFKAWFATRRVAEVDVCHLKRASGQSNFSFLRAGPGYGKILTKAFVNRLTGRWFTLDW